MSSSHLPSEDGYVRVPKWALVLGFAVLIMVMILGLLTFPASPLANSSSAIANAPRSAETITVSPRTITSASRTLGDPNAKTQLVEFGDFQ